jgi:hypothetical protein
MDGTVEKFPPPRQEALNFRQPLQKRKKYNRIKIEEKFSTRIFPVVWKTNIDC